MADVNPPSPVTHFLELLSIWDYSLPLTTQWAVIISPEASENGDQNGLFQIIKEYTQVDVTDFYIPLSIQNKLLNGKTQPNIDGLGLYYAQSIRMPKESFSPQFVGVDNMGGFLKGTVGSDRLDMGGRHLNIDFLETNIDFADGLIRPWIIAASYKGLINTGRKNSIKCSIVIQEFTRQKDADNVKPIRKIHTFEGCVPTDVSERILKYDSEEILIKSVGWIYTSYKYQIDPNRLT